LPRPSTTRTGCQCPRIYCFAKRKSVNGVIILLNAIQLKIVAHVSQIFSKASGSSTLVEHLTIDPEIQGLNPASAQHQRKLDRKKTFTL
jgi:hypothetical protein